MAEVELDPVAGGDGVSCRDLQQLYETLRAVARPLIADAVHLRAELEELEQRAEAVAARAFGVLLALGMSKVNARKEIMTWRSVAGSPSSRSEAAGGG